MSVLGALIVSVSAAPNEAKFNASQTFEYAADPADKPLVVAEWRKGIGEKDFQGQGKTDFGLRLEKNAPTSTVVAVGAVLKGLAGAVVNAGDELGYDLKNGSPIESGSPRFNVSWTDALGNGGFSFVGGAVNGLEDAGPADQAGWTRFKFQLQDGSDAFPIVPVGATIESVVLIVDDAGQYVLDNIRFRDQFADKPGTSSTHP